MTLWLKPCMYIGTDSVSANRPVFSGTAPRSRLMSRGPATRRIVPHASAESSDLDVSRLASFKWIPSTMLMALELLRSQEEIVGLNKNGVVTECYRVREDLPTLIVSGATPIYN